MKNLVLVRHGAYTYDYVDGKSKEELTNEGLLEMVRITDDILKIFGKKGTKIISSPEEQANRAYSSAKIIGNSIGIDIIEDKRLFTKYEEVESYEIKAIDELCNEQEIDNLILVTHAPFVQGYARHILRKKFGLQEYVKKPETGHGIHFDMQKESFELLPKDKVS